MPGTTLPSEPQLSWAHLPILTDVFDLLSMRDIAASACVCRFWAQEASRDHRWKSEWKQHVSDHGLWRFASAAGGYREQLRANAIVRKGDYVASVFPLHRDGSISEVLLLDGTPPRILTCHHKPTNPNAVLLRGDTIKIWSTESLCAQKPLFVVHDVIKHLQLEDGRLFMWRIAEGAVVKVRSFGGHINNHNQDPDILHWTESSDLIASLLDPTALQVIDIPLESTFGRNRAPFEWIDAGCSNSVAVSITYPAQSRIEIKLLDIVSGRCFRKSSCFLAQGNPDQLNLHEECSSLSLLSRNSNPGSQIMVMTPLYDCRVFRWCLKDEWLDTKNRLNHLRNREAPYAGEINEANDVFLHRQAQLAAGEIEDNVDNTIPNHYAPVDKYCIHHIFTVPDTEPIVDLSVNSTAQRIYVICMQDCYILNIEGLPLYTIDMARFKYVDRAPSLHNIFGDMGPHDVGAFTWPLPNSTRCVIHLEATNSIHITEFKHATHADLFPEMYNRGPLNPSKNYPYRDVLYMNALDSNGFATRIHQTVVDAHVDLRPLPQTSMQTSITGRSTRGSDTEPVIVEYIQSGGVVYTSGDSACPSTAALLRKEQAQGTYVAGLGITAAANGKSSFKKGMPVVLQSGHNSMNNNNNKGKGAKNAKMASRALICIDSITGEQYKAIPIEGTIEGVHAAGHYLVAAVAPVTDKGYAASASSSTSKMEGALVVIDFSKQGFGIPPENKKEVLLKLEEKEEESASKKKKTPEKKSKGGAGNGKSKKSTAAGAGKRKKVN